MKQELVRDWMSTDIITITPETTLPEAERLMITHVIRRLPVVDNGRLVGIVTYGDIRGARPSRAASINMWELDFLAAQLKVSEFMTHQPVTVAQDVTIGEAAQLMLKSMIRGLPVLDSKGKLIGIVTESDIFRLVAREWARQEEGLLS
jgi:acetoin utilization protein AcuB